MVNINSKQQRTQNEPPVLKSCFRPYLLCLRVSGGWSSVASLHWFRPYLFSTFIIRLCGHSLGFGGAFGLICFLLKTVFE